jgi:hypothetical protein
MDYDQLERMVLDLKQRVQKLEARGVQPPEAIVQTMHHPVLLPPPPQKSSPPRNK